VSLLDETSSLLENLKRSLQRIDRLKATYTDAEGILIGQDLLVLLEKLENLHQSIDARNNLNLIKSALS